MSKKADAPQPMDATIREEKTGVAKANNQRVCWAIKTLVAEVHALFPETPVKYSDYDGRNTALTVAFDCSELDENTQEVLVSLFRILDTDPRVEDVDFAEDRAFVAMKSNAVTQDSRETFGLNVAYEILTEGEDDAEMGVFGDSVIHGLLSGNNAVAVAPYPYFGGSL